MNQHILIHTKYLPEIPKDYKKTIKVIHKNDKQFRCHLCFADFDNRSNYDSHMEVVHGNSKTERCTKCKKQIHKSHMKTHMKNHSKARKPFPCNQCTSVLSNRCSLAVHVLQVHKKGGRIRCLLCQDNIVKGYFKVHMATVHEKRGRRKCPKCKKQITKGNMKSHMEIHENIRKTFPCNECPSFLRTKRILAEHILQVHRKGRRIRCLLCQKEIVKGALKAHIAAVHEKTDRAKCPKCNKEMSKSNIRVHMEIHEDEIKGKTYPCTECPAILSHKNTLISHISRVHKKLGKKRCPKCQKEISKGGMKEHIEMVHEKSDRIKCPKCEKKICKGNMSKHILIHEDRIKWKCPSCPAELYSKYSLNNHLGTVHGKESKEECPICKKEFHKGNMKGHMKTHSDETFKCSQCPAVVKYLALHINMVHNSAALEKCPICNKEMHKHRIKKHIETHSAVRETFACNKCPATLSSKSKLRRHMATVHGEAGRKKCPICDKEISRDSLKLHLSVMHDSRAREKCPECKKEVYKDYMERHMEIHSDDRPKFKCDKCPLRYAHKQTLRSHQRKFHSDEYKI